MRLQSFIKFSEDTSVDFYDLIRSSTARKWSDIIMKIRRCRFSSQFFLYLSASTRSLSCNVFNVLLLHENCEANFLSWAMNFLSSSFIFSQSLGLTLYNGREGSCQSVMRQFLIILIFFLFSDKILLWEVVKSQ